MNEPTLSPCILLCQLDAVTGWCRGCYRTIEEIMAWPELAQDAKRLVLADLPRRGIILSHPDDTPPSAA